MEKKDLLFGQYKIKGFAGCGGYGRVYVVVKSNNDIDKKAYILKTVNEESEKLESDIDIIRSIPNDQYTCSECGYVPEIINLYFESGIIEINCPIHGEKILQLDTYFKEEMNHIYYSFNCQRSGLKQSDYLDINEKDYLIITQISMKSLYIAKIAPKIISQIIKII